MNLYALDDQGRFIFASQAVKQRDYRCRECGATVRLRGGPYRQHHFYHVSHNRSCLSSGKSLIHLQVQHHLQKLLPDNECYLEWRFDEINRIADVVWFSKKLVFEVQCSDITVKEVESRNTDYEQVGFTVIWILHDRRYNKRAVHPVELLLRGKTFYFTNISSDGKGAIYDQYDIVDSGTRKAVISRAIPDCSSPQRPFTTQFASGLPNLVLQRLQNSQLFFDGDIVGKCLESDDKEFLKKVKMNERRFLLRKKWGAAKNGIRMIGNAIMQPYLSVFRILLERFCR